MAAFEKIVKLTSQLFPTGRAFRAPVDGDFDLLKKALARSEARFHDDAKSTLDSLIPDNDNFTAEDATAWERRLGLITNTNVSLADRKLAIQRKLNHPGGILPRQNYRFLERELRAAGFDVYVYENRFDYGDGSYYTKTPEQFSLETYPTVDIEHSDDVEHGEFEHGGQLYSNKVVNHVDEEIDDEFDVGSNYRSTFFIGYSPAGAWAHVDDARKQEFRQMVLRLKPVQTVGFILVHFDY